MTRSPSAACPNGPACSLERFLPRLREMGVAPGSIDAFMVRNPARLLTFVEPSTA